MTLSVSFIAAFIALAYSAWSIVGKASGAGAAWVGIVVMVISIVIVGLVSTRELTAASFPLGKALAMLAFAGLLNGIAIYLHVSTAADKTVPTGVFVTTVFALMVLWTPILSLIINGESITFYKGAGMMTIIAGIVLMAL